MRLPPDVTTRWNAGRLGKTGCAFLAAPLLAAGSPLLADDGLGIRKIDPRNGATVPLGATKMHPGAIYSHFDPALGRRVWSQWMANGEFGMAFGPGSAQPAKLFNINLPPNEALKLLRLWDPDLANDTVREGTEVFLRLADDQRWRVARTSVAMIYDPLTGYRFEQQFGRYVPVSHMDGYRWRPAGARFAPAP